MAAIRKPAAVIGSLGVAAALGMIAIGTRRLYFAHVPPNPGTAIGQREAEAFADAARVFSGRIVWSSNRSGNHEIYLLDLRGAKPELRMLTRDPHVDTRPRFSPDGTHIVWNRSRDPWVTSRDADRWDVWIMNADGSGQRRVAEFGFHPSFTRNGRAVVFGREGKVIRASVDGGREKILLDGWKEVGGWGHEPDLDHGRLAITVRGDKRAFGVFGLADRRFVRFEGSGCMISWWPDGRRLYWVQSQGRGGNRIATGAADGSAVETLLDLPGDYSHEYFPSIDRSGDWMVLGAAAEGHELDRADYEIFLWRIGDPPERAMRITYHTGNDQWPDVFPEVRSEKAPPK